MTRRYVDIAEVAKIVRGELKAAFPKTKFSVTISRYSMGSNMSVKWTDGPTVKDVEAITDQFYGTGFDGMTDSSTHHDSVYKGETVHFAGSRPHCYREISQSLEETCAQAWSLLTGQEQCDYLNRSDFPRWPEDRPGYRLAIITSAEG